ncbi:MAG: DUF1667 domain-containing protein [Christensenellales bacterium]|jgi:CxxC motif-containing protein
MTTKITCIGCPLGCEIAVTTDQGKVTDIKGYSCKKGEDYARIEMTDPRRILTTTMRVNGGRFNLVSVKSNVPIKKELLFLCMKEINKSVAYAPVGIGDVLIADILGTGADIVATSNR